MTYRFGRFTLDGDTRQLLHGDEEIHLSPKAFDLLTLLLVNRPRAMAKAELQERLWPSTFVEETNLAGLVAEIRRALRDEATHPTFVRTMYRFGYRFVDDVVEDVHPKRPPHPGAGPCVILNNKPVLLMDGANVIGRERDAAIHCDAPGVSRHHARILVSPGQTILEDLGSKNGTYVGGKRVTSTRLADGDEIRLGTARLIFRVTPPTATTETVAAED